MKKLFVIFSVISVAYLAQADWLLWQVTDDDVANFESATGTSVEYVQVCRVSSGSSSGSALTSYSLKGDNMGTAVGVAYEDDEQAKISGTDLGASYSYYVELLNSNSQVIGKTKTANYATYASLVNAHYIVGDDVSTVPQANVWHGGGSFEAVPEPSSMALFALGAGLVGLRRKLRKNKKGKRA